jgi:H+/Cl- antiporter ClcA
MRIGLIVAGLLIAALGVGVLMGKLQYTQDKEVLKVGDFSAKVQQEQSAPQWLGIAGLVLGGALVLAGVVRKS